MNKTEPKKSRRLTNGEITVFIKYLLDTQGTGLEINPKTWPEPALGKARDHLRKKKLL